MPFLFYFRQMFWPLDTLWLVVGGALAAALLVALRPAQPGSRVLVVTLVFIANSTFCYSMGLLARGAEAKRAWNHAEYATEPFVVGLMLVSPPAVVCDRYSRSFSLQVSEANEPVLVAPQVAVNSNCSVLTTVTVYVPL